MPAGRTLIEQLFDEYWSELDTIVEHLMANSEPEVSDFNSGVQYQDIDCGEADRACKEWGEWRGQAQGMAYALALLTNPGAPDIEAIREEAMQRWEEKYG